MFDLDVTSATSVEAAAQAVLETWGAPDAVGSPQPEDVEDRSPTDPAAVDG